jgi:hypothetical protein
MAIRRLIIADGLVIGPGAGDTSVEVYSNNAILIPAGTTGERPTSPANGMFRYNTTTSLFEFYDNGIWENLWNEGGGTVTGSITINQANVITNGGTVTFGTGGEAPKIIANTTQQRLQLHSNAYFQSNTNSSKLYLYVGGNQILGYAGTGDNLNVNGALIVDSLKFNSRVVPNVESIYIPAGAFVLSNTKAYPEFGFLQSGSTNSKYFYLAFDPSLYEFTRFCARMPESWDGGDICAKFYWSHPATTTNFNVRWEIGRPVAFSDSQTINSAYGGVQSVLDTGGTTDRLYATGNTANLTIGGSGGDLLSFQMLRASGSGDDTLAVDARLHGITLYVTVNSFIDI